MARKSLIHAFMLMPNHLHLLLTTPNADLDIFMRDFVSYTTTKLNLRSGRSGRIFGARYHWQIVDSSLYYAHCLKYVHRNPVKAGLCEKVEDWRWSTFHGMLGREHLPLPLSYPRGGVSLVPEDHAELVEWLNKPYPKEAEEALQKALRRSIFKIPLDRTTRKPSILETQLF